jgi:hypothetical protein
VSKKSKRAPVATDDDLWDHWEWKKATALERLAIIERHWRTNGRILGLVGWACPGFGRVVRRWGPVVGEHEEATAEEEPTALPGLHEAKEVTT